MCSRSCGGTPKKSCCICEKPMFGISNICKRCKDIEEEQDKKDFYDEKTP